MTPSNWAVFPPSLVGIIALMAIALEMPPMDAALAFRSGAVGAWAVWDPNVSLDRPCENSAG